MTIDGGMNKTKANLLITGAVTIIGGIGTCCSGVGAVAGVCAIAGGTTTFLAGLAY